MEFFAWFYPLYLLNGPINLEKDTDYYWIIKFLVKIAVPFYFFGIWTLLLVPIFLFGIMLAELTEGKDYDEYDESKGFENIASWDPEWAVRALMKFTENPSQTMLRTAARTLDNDGALATTTRMKLVGYLLYHKGSKDAEIYDILVRHKFIVVATVGTAMASAYVAASLVSRVWRLVTG